jgi:hypothetical protein
LPLFALTTAYQVARDHGFGVNGDAGQPATANAGAIIGDPGADKFSAQTYCSGRYMSGQACFMAEVYNPALAVQQSLMCGTCHLELIGPTCTTDGALVVHCASDIIIRSSNGNLVGGTSPGGTYPPTATMICPQHSLAPLQFVGSAKECASDDRVELTGDQARQVLATASASQAAQIARGVSEANIPSGQDVPSGISAPSAWDIPSGDPALSGPANYGQPEVTVTNPPDGGPPTTVTKQPTIAYDGSNYKWGSTTTTAAPGGTTTETKTGGTAGAQDPCAADQTRLGCAHFGDPDSLARSERSLVFTPVELSEGACPAAVTFDAFGHTYSMPFARVCDAVTTIVHPVVLILGAAAAAFIFIGGLKA